jgi:hypothetical protein
MKREDYEASEQVQEIIDALRDLLGGPSALHDRQAGMFHIAMPTRWYSGPESEASGGESPFAGCNLAARINDRWTLLVGSGQGRGFHHDAESIVKWAAELLAVHLPRREPDDETMPPPGGGGGSGGGAEIGIPVWWARKTRSS